MARAYPVGFPKKVKLIDNDVDTSTVSPVAVDAKISSIRISNPTAGALTFGLQDIAATANEWFEAMSIAANSIFNEQFPEGQELFLEGGFTYIASGAGLDMQIVYWTRP